MSLSSGDKSAESQKTNNADYMGPLCVNLHRRHTHTTGLIFYSFFQSHQGSRRRLETVCDVADDDTHTHGIRELYRERSAMVVRATQRRTSAYLDNRQRKCLFSIFSKVVGKRKKKDLAQLDIFCFVLSLSG